MQTMARQVVRRGKTEKTLEGMTAKALRDLNLTIPEWIRNTARRELAKELKAAPREYTMRVDGKAGRPLFAVERKVEYFFLGALSEVMFKTVQRVARRNTYKTYIQRTGALKAEWQWYYNGQPVEPNANLPSFTRDDRLWFVMMRPYAVKANQATRADTGHSIITHTARSLRRNRTLQDYYFKAIYVEIDGMRRPAITVKPSLRSIIERPR